MNFYTKPQLMLSFIKRMLKQEKVPIDQKLVAGAVVLDVRTQPEFQSGHFPGSKNIPLNEVSRNMESIRKWNKPVIAVCRSGNRSRLASSLLCSAGIKVHDGGAWTNLQDMYKEV